MAGTYPDVPSWRMAYDRDGTQVVRVDGSTITQQSTTIVNGLNSESTADTINANSTLAFLFPQPRDFSSIFVSTRRGHSSWAVSVTVTVSTDTTNGLDGTWTTFIDPYSNPEQISKEHMRNTIKSATTVTGIKGVRVYWRSGAANATFMKQIHLYGNITAATGDRLQLWHPTTDARVGAAYFDWGDVPRSSTATRSFRIKNLSTTLTAQSVRVFMQAPTNSTPSLLTQMQVSADGGTTWASEVNIGNLAAGATSGVLQLRRSMAADAALGLWWYRVLAESTTGWV